MGKRVKWTRRNIAVPPWVAVRISVIGPLWLLSHVGDKASAAGRWLSYKIPGFED